MDTVEEFEPKNYSSYELMEFIEKIEAELTERALEEQALADAYDQMDIFYDNND